MGKKKKVLFLCTANSSRSQMAEGIIRYYYRDTFDAYSAGAKLTIVHPLAIKVMTESGIDISLQRSKSVAEFAGHEFDCVITLCGDYAKDACPVFLGKAKERLHWNFMDPQEAEGSKEALAIFRQVRDEIKAKIDDFVKELAAREVLKGRKKYSDVKTTELPD